MPAAISHWILGQRIVNSDCFAEEFPNVNKEAFLWGCQGPDIFFYHRQMPWQSKDSLSSFGNHLHELDPVHFFRSLSKICRYCAELKDSDLIFSYALGHCCHYSYDRKLHPLVYYNTALLEKTDRRGFDYKYHADIEANMDIILLSHEGGKLIGDINIKDTLPQFPHSNEVIARLYKLMFRDIFGLHPSDFSLYTLAGDFVLNMGLLDDKYAVKKPLISSVEKLLPNIREGALSGLIHAKAADLEFDYGNLCKNMWFNPSDRSERYTMSLYEITDAAEDDTWEFMRLFAEAVRDRQSENFDEFIRGINYEGNRVDDDVIKF
ncbi:MAG: zinc dependent phospholipase C family protein [Acutalibacteraceae bacterium]